MRIEFSPPDITEAEIEAVVDALRSGWITTGPRVKQFERELASWCEVPRSVCLSSATSALESALRQLGIGPGDEVITSAYTYTASASVVCHVGATLVLADTASGSYEIDYEALANLITPRTKAIIPVDIAGVMCDYETLEACLTSVSERFSPTAGTLQEAFNRVPILTDGAHSFGATYQGQPSGSVADFTTFSFHAVKNITTAEGGALVWRAREGIDDEAFYQQLMLLSLHGQNKDAFSKSRAGAWEYDVIAPLYKCNMTDLTAALGLAQLKRYPQMLARRHVIVERYVDALASSNIELLSHHTERGVSSGHLCLIRLIGQSADFRNRLIARMAECDITCNVHYKPLPLLTAYRNLGFDITDFPNALAQFENEVTLPLHSKLSDAEVDYVVESFQASYEECVRAGV
ncbi:MAG: DegT/DnrJ/EryC1/StrS family aminotransferase [Coriobacteriales bacterium]|nr:DegT/DnrJ/EryC1/StrS family aminotransferase [Coriobacteriales bacterium]